MPAARTRSAWRSRDVGRLPTTTAPATEFFKQARDDGPIVEAGLSGLAKAAVVELAAARIRVSSVSPGWVATDAAEETAGPAVWAHMRQDFDRVPIDRLITTEEVAHTVVHLVGPGATGIAGADLLVDGGTLANRFVLEPSRTMFRALFRTTRRATTQRRSHEGRTFQLGVLVFGGREATIPAGWCP